MMKSKLRIKVDEDLPPVIADLLRNRGYEASTVVEQLMGGYKDAQLWKAVQAEGKLLITADKGFANIREHPPGTHAGVLLLRPDEDGIRPMLDLIHTVLSTFELEALAGTIAVASPRGIRLRR